MSETGLLDGKQEISDYLKGASDYKLKKWVADGMPVLVDNGRWTAHKQNLEDFFKAYTRKRANPDQV